MAKLTTMNIIVRNDNFFLRDGFNALLASIFPEAVISMRMVNEFNQGDGLDADILILSLCRGEEYICHPELLNCRVGVLIGLVDRRFRWRGGTLPLCLQEIVFIRQDEKIYRIIAQIKNAQRPGSAPALNKSLVRCEECRHRKLSPQQGIVAAALLAGHSVKEIAGKLALNDKTVFSHKRVMMAKFNLRHDVDLVLLLNYLRNEATAPRDIN